LNSGENGEHVVFVALPAEKEDMDRRFGNLCPYHSLAWQDFVVEGG
jgi:hypothetical protein